MKRILALLAALILCALSVLPALADGMVVGEEEEPATLDFLYIIPDSDVRELTADELWNYSCETLGFIRNEILARHGYAFQNKKFFDYFNAKPWYVAGGYKSIDQLNNIERRNHFLVRQVENAMISTKKENLSGIRIEDIIEAQNAYGGYGNYKAFGNQMGNGEGRTYAEVEKEEKLIAEIEIKIATATPNYIYNKEYIIPDSDTRLLSEGELWAYSREALRYIRNEILARHGFIFGGNKFGLYFQTKSWYVPSTINNDAVYALVTELEWKNINLIRQIEGLMDQIETENPDGLDIITIIENQNNGTYPG